MDISRTMVPVNGIEILCLDTRTPGPAILCLHGRWGRGETWTDFLFRYGGRYRVLAPDQRGHGLSGKPASAYTAEEMAGDMAALLDAFAIDSAIVVGHSMGGTNAAWLAAHRPERVRALAVLDKSAGGPAPSARPPDPVAPVDPVTKDWPVPFATRREAEECIRRAEGSEHSVQYFLASLVEAPAGYGMLFSTQAIAANIAHYTAWYHLLPKIACPVLLMRAVGSGAVPDEDWERMKALLPGCTAVDIANPDHNVHRADPDAFYAAFDAFLARVEGAD